MLTRLEISGFKSFTDFEVDFAPLTVIAGANASGKSNLIEALCLVQGLAIRGSFGAGLNHQGNLKDLFTKYDQHSSADRISIGLEYRVPNNYLEGFGKGLILFERFRYEVEITNRDNERLGTGYEITQERLFTDDKQPRKYFLNQGAKDRKEEISKNHPLSNVTTTIEWTELSEASISSDPHLFASKRLISEIITTDLINPSNFSDYEQSKNVSRSQDPNGILPSLVRLKHVGLDHLHSLGSRVRRIVNDVVDIDVYTDDYNRSTVTATDTEGRSFLASNLSEGTLRIIALASYLLKRKPNQVLLIEEPENGIDPRVITELLALLVDLSVNHNEAKGEQWQVICTTHSPILLQAVLNIEDQEEIKVLLTNKVGYLRNIGGKRYKLKSTRMNPVIRKESVDGDSTPLELYTLREAMEYLSPAMEEKIQEDA
jgi:AAA15 family ATPase/GTPase